MVACRPLYLSLIVLLFGSALAKPLPDNTRLPNFKHFDPPDGYTATDPKKVVNDFNSVFPDPSKISNLLTPYGSSDLLKFCGDCQINALAFMSVDIHRHYLKESQKWHPDPIIAHQHKQKAVQAITDHYHYHEMARALKDFWSIHHDAPERGRNCNCIM